MQRDFFQMAGLTVTDGLLSLCLKERATETRSRSEIVGRICSLGTPLKKTTLHLKCRIEMEEWFSLLMT